ncbi:MAG: hypothetical protein SWO11_14750 [Thermodesulfobacteriota bacterium]|nr:hypothetical protein [Thermodesulfobacteriota bacterium]
MENKMPIEYDIIKEKNTVIVVGSGVISATDIINHLDSLAEDDRYTAPMKKLVDYRDIESINILPDEAEIIAQRKKKLSKKFSGEKCAFVSPSDLTYGTARVHQALIDGTDINTQVFRSFEEALDWLNITMDHGSKIND